MVAFQKQYRIFSQLRVAKHDYISDLKKVKKNQEEICEPKLLLCDIVMSRLFYSKLWNICCGCYPINAFSGQEIFVSPDLVYLIFPLYVRGIGRGS